MTYHIRNVPVQIADTISVDHKLMQMVSNYIDDRLSKAIIAFPQDGKTVMRLTTPAENARSMNAPCKHIQLTDCTGRIYPVNGLHISDLTKDDMDFAQKLWYETIYVEKGQDGTPWIDD